VLVTGGEEVRGVDLTAGALGAPTQRDSATGEGRFAGLMRAILPWPSSPTDPVADLLKSHKTVHPHADVNLLRRAYAIAERMHRGQMRKSGEEYITHPLAVAQILADLGMDTTTLVAALLHDTVEDTTYTLHALREEFGPRVALLVDGVTKFDKAYFGETAEVETIRKMLVLAGRDIRVLIIKLADRLHNMRTLDARSPASRARIAKATREVIVPLCDRLGIQALKRELEDTVLLALEPEAYAEIDAMVRDRPEWTAFLDTVIGTLQPELARSRISATIAPRPRHFYTIWKDTTSAGRETWFDLPRIVIVVDGDLTDCYTTLGSVHATWRPVPGRFKDFIASPKNNLYRSLHTTVVGPDDRPLEVLIRTQPMHRAAEYGIVVNFRYPDLTARLTKKARAEQVAWLRRVLDWQVAADDAKRFMSALRSDLTEGQIHVFTLDGDTIQLPAGGTPVDLAYTLGTEIGHGCVGARRGGRLIPLSSPLSDGDVVEIIYQTPVTSGPSREWLSFVTTPEAQLEIGRWFGEGSQTATISDKVRLGRAAIGLALRAQGRGLSGDAPLLALAGQLGYPELEALLVAVAEHRLNADELVSRMIEAVDYAHPDAALRGTGHPWHGPADSLGGHDS
jgi:guanosine-3',5'-bis(diphosphate) 3'-pyrophosphohydrolase